MELQKINAKITSLVVVIVSFVVFSILSSTLAQKEYAAYRECTNSGSACAQVCGQGMYADVTQNVNGTYNCACAGSCAGKGTQGQSCGNNASGTCQSSPSGAGCNNSPGGVCGTLYCCTGSATGSNVTKSGTTSSGSSSNSSSSSSSSSSSTAVNSSTTGYSCQCNTSDQFLCIPTGSNATSGLPNVTGSCSAISKANAANSNSPVSIGSTCALPGVTQVTSADATTVAQTMCGNTNASNTSCSYGGSLSCTNICKNISAGGYCGETIGGDGSYVYTCDGSGKVTAGEQCGAAGCQVNIPGIADCCAGDAGCNTSSSVIAVATFINVNDLNGWTFSGTQLAEAHKDKKVLAAQVLLMNDTLSYNATSDTFSNPAFKIITIPPGQYIVMLHVDGYLDKRLTQAGSRISISNGQTTLSIPPTHMIIGDVAPMHGDNIIDIQDYNAVLSCVGQTKPSETCPNPSKMDLHKDGSIGQDDLDVITKEFNQKGDIPVPAQFTCVTDPTCVSGDNSMQVCALKCSVTTPNQ